MKIVDGRISTVFGRKVEPEVSGEAWFGGRMLHAGAPGESVEVGVLSEGTKWTFGPVEDESSDSPSPVIY